MTPSALADVGTATVSLLLLSFMSLHAAWPPGALSAITRVKTRCGPYESVSEDLGASECDRTAQAAAESSINQNWKSSGTKDLGHLAREG